MAKTGEGRELSNRKAAHRSYWHRKNECKELEQKICHGEQTRILLHQQIYQLRSLAQSYALTLACSICTGHRIPFTSAASLMSSTSAPSSDA